VFLQVLALVLGLCYSDTLTYTQAGVQAIEGVLFLFVTENTFSPIYSTLATFPLELPLFMREYRSGLYNTTLYYLSKVLAMVSFSLYDLDIYPRQSSCVLNC
jgi:hypothetical protein